MFEKEQHTPDVSASTEPLSAGQRFLRAREEQYWTVEEVADRLHLSHSVIRDLESDQTLPGIAPIYVRGYYRAYIKLLGLDEADFPILSKREDAAPHCSEFMGVAQDLPVYHQRRDKPSHLRFVTWLVVIVLATMVIIWWRGQNVHQSSKAVLPVANAQASGINLPLDQAKGRATATNYTVKPVRVSNKTGNER